MGKYGTAAVMATKLYEGLASSPNDAWVKAVAQVFPSSESSREKVALVVHILVYVKMVLFVEFQKVITVVQKRIKRML